MTIAAAVVKGRPASASVKGAFGPTNPATLAAVIEANNAALSAQNWASVAQAAAMLAPVSYPDTATGISSTTSGQYFWVVAGNVLELYRNVSGSAVDQNIALNHRIPLTADLDLFFDTVHGSNSNDGLTSGTAFADAQHAFDYIYTRLDCNGHKVKVHAVAGSTIGTIVLQGKPFGAADNAFQPLQLIGNETTPILQSTSSDAIKLKGGAYLLLDGIKTVTSGAGVDAWTAEDFSTLEHKYCQHGDCGGLGGGVMFAAHYYGQIRAVGSYSCVGDGDSFVHATYRGTVSFAGQTFSWAKSGGNSFSTYLFGLNDATCDCDSATISGKVIAGRTTIHEHSKLNFSSANLSGLTSSILGPGALIYADNAIIMLDGWATLNFYVDPAGSDNNTGIGPETWNALKTLTGVRALLAMMPINPSTTNAYNNQVVIHLADGTYINVTLTDLPNYTAAKITGNATTPSNVVIQGTGQDAVISTARKTVWQIDSVRPTTSGGSSHGLRAEKNVTLLHSNIDWGACSGAHKWADTGGRIINVGSAESISGDATYHAEAEAGAVIDLASVACTTSINGARTFTAFLRGDDNSLIRAKSNLITWGGTGTVTGSRFTLTNGARINTNGGGAQGIPGSTAGVCSTGGACDVGNSSAPIVLAQGSNVSLTGTTSATNMVNVTVPANSIGKNGHIEIDAFFSGPNNANNKTLAVKMGGNILLSSVITTQLGDKLNVQVANRNAANSQVAAGLAAGYGNVGPTYTAVDTTAAFTIQFTGTLGNSGDTLILEYYRITLYPKG